MFAKRLYRICYVKQVSGIAYMDEKEKVTLLWNYTTISTFRKGNTIFSTTLKTIRPTECAGDLTDFKYRICWITFNFDGSFNY